MMRNFGLKQAPPSHGVQSMSEFTHQGVVVDCRIINLPFCYNIMVRYDKASDRWIGEHQLEFNTIDGEIIDPFDVFKPIYLDLSKMVPIKENT